MQTKLKERVATVKASAWSHVHIASGEKIERWDYYFDQDKLWLLDESKLAVVVGQDKRLVDDMTKAAADSNESLNSFLSRYPGLKQQLRKVGRQVPKAIISQNSLFPKIREIRLFAGSPNCYIPGSSIKGAIRTAIISDLIQKGKLPLSQDATTLNRELKDGFSLNSSDNMFFKNLLISDSANLPEKDFGIASVEIYARDESRSRDRDRGPKRPSNDTYCELLLWDSEFEFEIKLRSDALGRADISVNSVKDLLEIVDAFNRKVWRKEKFNRSDPKRNSDEIIEFYSDEPKDCYLMRLGFGSGQLATSVLGDYQDRYKGQDLRLRQGRIYKDSYTAETGKDFRQRTPYPYTSKTAVATDGKEELQMPLGWVKIPKDGVKEHAD